MQPRALRENQEILEIAERGEHGWVEGSERVGVEIQALPNERDSSEDDYVLPETAML